MKKEIINIINGINKITTNAELGFVIDAINARGTIVRAMESATAKVGLAVGDTVTFTGKRNKTMEGIITKMKIKNAIVNCKNDQGAAVLWNCPFSMLEVV